MNRTNTLMVLPDTRVRCPWAGDDPLYVAYHDTEWGVPLRDDPALFELLNLEGAQAGLAWITILRKRDGYRRAFAGFDPEVLAAWGDEEETRLLADPGIVRNRAKVRAVFGNARAYLRLTDETGSFAGHLWSVVDGAPIQNRWARMDQVPAETDVSRALSADLRRRGFSFVGPTIVYAFMQSAGLVNDHLVDCFRHAEVARPAG
ncbi:MAG TPA: DNA-3-methyladenine glycosylase I [Candidatus Limnocylindria bacterium]|nr:DNA-3-methyladenine glycosylase I [Candidatus Limnocylindria bacterium]